MHTCVAGANCCELLVGRVGRKVCELQEVCCDAAVCGCCLACCCWACVCLACCTFGCPVRVSAAGYTRWMSPPRCMIEFSFSSTLSIRSNSSGVYGVDATSLIARKTDFALSESARSDLK